MSVINTNQFATGFASTSVQQEFDNAPGAAPGEYAAGYAQPSDNIQYGGYAPGAPIALPSFDPGAYGSQQYGSNGGFSFSSILNQIGNLISGLFQQLGSILGSTTSPGTGTTGTGTTGTGTAGPGYPAQPQPETYYTNATASSVGDPHLAFDGTTGDGGTASDKWNSMTSHQNLLSSDSFGGGYRVSTEVTNPDAAGITLNASASVTANGGATNVTMNKNGSYTVTDDGRNVSLTQGKTDSLGNGESVTLNADGSLTVADANAAGGTISTTLKSTGSAVDVTSTAHDVDLGGYLVNKTDHDVDPTAPRPGGFPYNPAMGYNGGLGPSAGAGANAGINYGAYPLPPNQLPEVTPAYQTPQAMVGGLEQFDPENEGTSLENIEYA